MELISVDEEKKHSNNTLDYSKQIVILTKDKDLFNPDRQSPDEFIPLNRRPVISLTLFLEQKWMCSMLQLLS